MLEIKQLMDEMSSLKRQRDDQLATLNRIDGAIELCGHLLAKASRQQGAAAEAGVKVEVTEPEKQE